MRNDSECDTDVYGVKKYVPRPDFDAHTPHRHHIGLGTMLRIKKACCTLRRTMMRVFVRPCVRPKSTSGQPPLPYPSRSLAPPRQAPAESSRNKFAIARFAETPTSHDPGIDEK